TLNYANSGSASALNVQIVDTLPAGVSFVSATDGGTPDGAGHVTFALGTVAAGASGSVTLTMQVTATGGTITNGAVINTTTGESNADNNSSSFTSSVISSADVTVTKTGPAGAVTKGTNITYTLNYANSGSAAALDVQIVDTLPSGVSF